MVLGSSLIVTLIGISALATLRVRHSASEAGHEFMAARLGAQSAIELGLYLIDSDADWRSRYAGGVCFLDRPMGEGTISLRVNDPNDADLTDCPEDPFVLVGTGCYGQATYHMRARLRPTVQALAALRTCLHAGGNITIDWYETVSMTDGPLSTNGDYWSGGYLTGDLHTRGFWTYYVVNGLITRPAPPKDLPDPGVFDEYVAVATPVGNPGNISRQLISPEHNPWGAKDADGLYYIDTGGADLWIEGTRVYGTLLVRTRGGRLHVSHDIHFSPVREDYPALIVDGDLSFGFASYDKLWESDWSMNFNPPGAPYEGQTDLDVSDGYRSEIRGLVHTTGSLTVESRSDVRGVVICEGELLCNKDLYITREPSLFLRPPKCYTQPGRPIVERGSWQRTLTAP